MTIMESNDSVEIICSNCGRPNLPEAVKCWYCQSPLEKELKEEHLPTLQTQFQAEVPHEESKVAESEAAEEIPDWLKRIREIKQKNQAEEDARNQWQQERLFGTPAKSQSSQKPRKKENPPAIHKSREKPAIPEEPTVQPKLEIKQPSEQQVKEPVQEKPEKREPEIKEPTDELPDGFIKFDSKSN